MSLNKVFLIGNVGRDPDVRYIDNGVAVAQIRLATTEKGYTLPNGVQVPDRTEWHTVVLWRGLAQTVERYVKKGDKVFIEGQIRTRNYTDKSGKQRETLEIWAERLELMSRPATAQTNAATVHPNVATVPTGSQPANTPPSDGPLPF